MISASKKLDYGIMMMASLPDHGGQNFRSLQDVAQEKKLSPGFLSQLMIPLKKAGLVHAKEGLHGGYQLAKSRQDISLSEIYQALEGPLALTECLGTNKQCLCDRNCPTKSVWEDLQNMMTDYLEKKTLADFH